MYCTTDNKIYIFSCNLYFKIPFINNLRGNQPKMTVIWNFMKTENLPVQMFLALIIKCPTQTELKMAKMHFAFS